MTRDDRRRTIVAYDVTSDNRRTRVADLLCAHGDRVQYSVFVVDSSPARLLRLKRSLEKLLDLSEDSVLLCDLGPIKSMEEDRFTYLGRVRPISSDADFIM